MSFIDEKYILLVSSRLEKFSKKKSGLFNFRCNYCGDSGKNKSKARGYLYQIKNDYNYKCHNCGVSRSFTNFLKDIDSILYDQYILERYKNGLSGKKTNTEEPKFDIKKPVFVKEKLDLPKIKELNDEHPAKKYLMNRKIPEKYFSNLYFCEKFKEWTNKQKNVFKSIQYDESRIIIPLVKDGEIFGYQGRSLSKSSKVKYITIILDDNKPKLYGWDDVDWNKSVYIVEGPFDSMFLENSIAMVGADMDYMFFKNKPEVEFVFVYDNEKRNKEMINRVEKTIDMKFPIVIWPKDLKYKDINDMILAGVNVKKIIKENTFMGLEAKAKLIGWKRV
jgi:hypothetical protein